MAVATYSTSGAWTCPAGVTQVMVELWGAGGAGGGGGGGNKNGGGGGAGGQYVIATVSVTPGNTYSVDVGVGGTGVTKVDGTPGGDTSFGGGTALAKGGVGGLTYTGAAGTGGVGSDSGGVGDLVYAGGSGADGADTYSGGGGGGAGSGGAGGNATTTTGGTGTANYGGNGGDGDSSNSGNGSPGLSFGGGGGGATKNGVPGDGGPGFVYLTFTAQAYENIQIIFLD